jgi:hypothetical protein
LPCRCHGRRLNELPFSRAFHRRPTHPTLPLTHK